MRGNAGATSGRATMEESEAGRVRWGEDRGRGGRLRPPPPGSKTWRAPAAGPST